MTAITPKFDFSDIETGPRVEAENIDHSESRTPHNALTPTLFNEYERVMEEVCTAIGDYDFTDTVPAPSSSIATALRQTYNLKFDKAGGTITGATTLPSNNITAVQIESSTTSSAPFIVHSNTMVSGLNVQYLNGHIAPTGVIVGDSDSQTLSNKTITSSVLNSGEINSPVVNNGTITNSTANLSNGELTLPTAAIPNQTSDGQTVWDSTNKVLTIGDSTSRRTIVNTTNTQTLTNKTLQSPVINTPTLSEGNVDLGTGVSSVLRAPRKTTEVANTDTNTGSLAWNITTNRLTVGTGSSRVSLLDSESDQSITGTKTFNSIPAFNGGTSGDSSPFTVDSTQVVANLNADKFDGADLETTITNSDTKVPSSGAVINYSESYFLKYDYIVDSQAKFDALVASSTWFGAKNVLFTTVNVSRAAQTTIPATVEKIHAINGATLTVTGLTDGQYGFGYATAPTDPKFEVRSLKVDATGTGTFSGFIRCINLTNCTGTGTSTGSGTGYGFYSCTQLTNCTGSGTGTGTSTGIGFYSCTKLTDCTGTGTSTGTDTSTGYGFYSCTQLTNCTGTGTGTSTDTGTGIGLYSCDQLTNCTGTGTGTDTGMGFYSCTKLTECTGSGTGTDHGIGYGFRSCDQLTNCTGTGTSTDTGTGNGNGSGFSSCTQLTNCTGTGTGAGVGNGYGFSSCTQLTNCTGTGTSAGTGFGFYTCTNLTNCTGSGSGTGTGDGYGFHSCNQIIGCAGRGLSPSGTGYGYYDCKKCMCNKAGGASKTATYNTTSYAGAGTSNPCADTAAGGYNS